MYNFSKLFAKAPFDLLQLHMDKVLSSLVELEELLKNFWDKSLEDIEKLSKTISKLEHEADLIKNEIRALLPRKFLFAIDQHNFLETLALQDKLADIADDIASLLSLKPLTIPDTLKSIVTQYVEKVLQDAFEVKEIVFAFDELLEVSFGGPVAEKVRTQIEKTVHNEHEVNLLAQKVTKQLFAISDTLSTPDFYMWTRLIEEIRLLSHFSEKLALRIGMLLDIR